MNLTKVFWENVYKENAPKIIGVCYRYVQNKEIAEDLMQDAFITAMDKSDSYSGKGSFIGWLRKIAVNCALMYLRNEKLKKISDDLILSEHEYQNMDEPSASNIRTVVEQADFSDLELLEVINSLPEHHRLVFNLYVIDNYPHAQIGEELNISVGTSKSHLARARKKIKKLLHQKALERTQDQKKKKRAALLLIFTLKSNYIERIFRDKLNLILIEPLKKSSLIFDSVNWDRVTIPKFKSTPLSTNINFWVLGATTGIIVMTVCFCVFFNFRISAVPEIGSNSNAITDTIVQPIKTNIPTPNSDTDSIKNLPNIELEKKEPIVIKKKIIQRKTIVVRDTIRVVD